MKINLGEAWGERRARLSEWHTYYCWYPCRIGAGDWRWLERVERRGSWTPVEMADWGGYTTTGGWDWEYRGVA